MRAIDIELFVEKFSSGRAMNRSISRIFRINVFFLCMQLFRHRYDVPVSFPCASFFPL